MNYNKLLPWLAGLFVFIIYLFTIAPSVIQIDSGELAAVQILAGIAHPTGYPLFSITGYLWSLIPLPFSYIFKMNLYAALLCSIGVVLFVKSAFFIIRNIESFRPVSKAKPKSKGKKKQQEQLKEKEATLLPEVYTVIAVLTGALILAFSRTYWFQSTSVEVYSLHIALIMLVIYTLLKAYVYGGGNTTDYRWLIFAAALALGFTNHMTTLLILPGVAYLYFNKYGFNKSSFMRLGVMILLFIAVLAAVYSYLPLRASSEPILNWGNPVDMERILRHISGKQYQVWLFSSTESARKQFEYFITNLPSELGLSLLIAAAGIIISALYAKRIFLFFLITFIVTVLYSINYDIADIDSYFLLAYISLAFFVVFAILKAAEYFHRNYKGYKAIAAAAAVIIALQFYLNYDEADQSGNYIFEDYTKSLVNSVSENAIIFSYQWDYFISPAYYFQYVEGFREDAVIIDKELLRRSWYYKQIDNIDPQVFSGLQTEIGLFLDALRPFERDENYNAVLLENLFRRIMTGLVSTNIAQRDFYIAPEIVEGEMKRGEFILPVGYTLVPDLFLYKVVLGNEYVPASDPDFTIRFKGKDNYYTGTIKRTVGTMLLSRAVYELQFDRRDRAEVYLNKVKTDIPEFRIPQEISRLFN
jgi:hypothetical protein